VKKSTSTTLAIVKNTLSINITEEECKELRKREAVIQAERETFKQSYLRIGEALSVISKRQLYRAAYATFERYCEIRWGIDRQRG
jgi:hypothetical protein